MDYLLYFYIFSFFGWILETVYASVLFGRFTSKQTLLKSPLCPVYGIGAVVMIITLTPVAESWILLFCGGFFAASSVEYLVALYYEHYFGVMWWDYRQKIGNLDGKVCAELSLFWGIVAIALIKFIFPSVKSITDEMSIYLKLLICVPMTAFFINDYKNTLAEIKKYSNGETSCAGMRFSALKCLNY